MRLIILSLSTVLFLYACNNTNGTNKESESKVSSVENTSLTVAANSDKVISIAAFKIVDKSDKAGIEMNADGKCFFENKEFGTFGANGILTSNEGKIIAKLVGNNLVDSSGNNMTMIDTIGNFATKEGVKMTWSNEGHLMKDKEDKGFKLVPCNNVTKQVASAIIYLFFSVGKSVNTVIKASK